MHILCMYNTCFCIFLEYDLNARYQKSITYMKYATIILDHGIVLQEQWIWSICDVLFHKLTRSVSKGSNAVWETYPACERTVSQECTLAFIVSPRYGSPASSLRLRLVL